jgi:hypothetical protein
MKPESSLYIEFENLGSKEGLTFAYREETSCCKMALSKSHCIATNMESRGKEILSAPVQMKEALVVKQKTKMNL